MTRNSVTTNKEELVRDFRVREILEAARRVVARNGFQGVTIDRVAEEAKIAKGTVYLYFHTKEELLKAAVEQGMVNFTNSDPCGSGGSHRTLWRSCAGWWKPAWN